MSQQMAFRLSASTINAKVKCTGFNVPSKYREENRGLRQQQPVSPQTKGTAIHLHRNRGLPRGFRNIRARDVSHKAGNA